MIILASTSPYRRELLSRLGRSFETISPKVDETVLPDETPERVAARLAQAKAQAVADQLNLLNTSNRDYKNALVIGSDQTATLDGTAVIGKPGTHNRAASQLKKASGQTMHFFTAVSMVEVGTGKSLHATVNTTVLFRTLTDAQIQNYLHSEKPYDCAGSAKVEGLGISLIASVRSDDPTALIGLPLITVCQMLSDFGQDVLPNERKPGSLIASQDQPLKS